MVEPVEVEYIIKLYFDASGYHFMFQKSNKAVLSRSTVLLIPRQQHQHDAQSMNSNHKSVNKSKLM